MRANASPHHLAGLGLALLTAACLDAQAQAPRPADYPSRPVRLIVPFAPGGSTDVTARLVADGLRGALGQSVLVDNRPGATGTIGTLAAQQAAADGYTLLFTTGTNQIAAPLLMEKAPYDGARDFTPITILIRYLGVLLVSNALPVTTVEELIAYAKQRPGKLNYASSGVGSSNHLLTEMVKRRTGMDLVHIPYKGSAAAEQALAANEVQVFFDTLAGAQPWFRAAKVRVIASAGERSSLLPDVPSLVERGVLEGPSYYWMGLMAPPGLAPALVTRVHESATRAMTSPEMAQFAAKGGGEVALGTPAQFSAVLADEQRRLLDIIRANNIRAE